MTLMNNAIFILGMFWVGQKTWYKIVHIAEK